MGIRKIKLFLNTVKHLKPIQLYYRFYYYFRNKFFNKEPVNSPVLVLNSLKWETKVNSASSFSKKSRTFTFLNISHNFQEKIDWNYNEYGKLWTYNLNYFDFLNQKTINKKYILEIRYEDLLEDTPKSLSKILDFIGITLSQDNLKEAVRYCDISNMRKLEENYGDGVNYSDKSFNFTRREKLRNIDIISDEEIKSYQESNKALLEKMKYL